MWLTFLLALSIAFIILATTRLRLHPFLALLAAAFGFGSYMNRESTDVPGGVAIVVLADTMVAFVAGLVIFPALFSFGLEPNEGPGLLFLTMTNLFARMPAGQLFGAAFFFLMILAAITSAGAMQEVLTTTLTDLVPMRRRTATWGFAALLATLSTPIVLSQGPWSGFRPFHMPSTFQVWHRASKWVMVNPWNEKPMKSAVPPEPSAGAESPARTM